MELELLPTDREDAEVISKANEILKVINHNTMASLYYIKSTIVSQNRVENEYNKLVTTSKAKQLELTEKYYLLSEKYSDLVDKHIASKEQHDPI